MKKIILLVTLLASLLFSNPIDNVSSWIDGEYKNFRTYPRINKAQTLIEEGKTDEAKILLEKSLEIDGKNSHARKLLLKLCIQNKDQLCMDKYAQGTKDLEIGYFYKNKAEEAKKELNHTDVIRFSKKAMKYNIKNDDKYFIKLIMFESYLKLKEYKEADKLIDKKNINMYKLFEWSKIADNIDETNYAYNLATELPNKLEYVEWRMELLLKSKRYAEASKELEIINKIKPSSKNKKQLIHLYALTKKKDNILKIYNENLTKGCDKYSLNYLLDYYKKNKSKNNNLKKEKLLEELYPFKCLSQKKRIYHSLELIDLLKKKNPKKVKKIANDVAGLLKSKKDLINLYQNSGQTNKLAQLYKKQLKKKCDKYALYFLLDYYKNNSKSRENILNQNYPYACLTNKEQNKLSLELVNLIEDQDQKKTQYILNHLHPKSINPDKYLYLSNLETTLENYDKSIEYAQKYLLVNPKNIDAIKNIGYAYFQLGKKDLSVHYLMKASKLNPNDSKLLKNIGYLCIDLELYTTATYYWNLYLQKEVNPKIQLELASLYHHKLHKTQKAKKVLLAYEQSTQEYNAKYYLLKAKLFHNQQNCKETLSYYSKALKSQRAKHTRYEYIHLLQQCKQPSKALVLMQKFSDDYPDNLQYKKELAYMYETNKKYAQAIKNYKEIKTQEPDSVDNYVALAYTYKKNHQKEKAITAFKESIDKSKNMSHIQKVNIKHEITNDSKVFNFYLAQAARLNSYKTSKNISPIHRAGYDGFGNIRLSYKPAFLTKDTKFYANINHAHKNIKERIQASVGVQYKPLKNHEFYVSAEQLIKTGKVSRNETLLRTSLGISSKPTSEIKQKLYVEGAYFVKGKSSILYGNYDIGKSYKINKQVNVMPYLTTGGTYNNDNLQNQSVTRLDLGMGVAFNILSGESKYEMNKYKNILKVEARKKYAGNSKDKQSLRLQWEFFY